MADRAALVEKVARAMEKADSHAYEYQLTSSWEHLAEAAIDLIRAEVLEEAEGICRNKQRAGKDAQSCAAAIRALKGDSNDR
jgi:hypothetical protein